MPVLTRELFEPFVRNNVMSALTQGRNEYWSYIHHAQAGSVYNNDEIKDNLRLWKNKNVDCLKCNFKTFKFYDKTFYYFVITPKEGDVPFDPVGLFVKDIDGNGFMVSGYGYFCRREINREKIWKYLGSRE